MDDMQEAIENAKNPWQDNYKRVLCVCSAGLLRSPTAAWVLSQEPFSYNTRACGVESYAVIPLSAALIEWADEIVVMGGREHTLRVENHPHFKLRPKPIKVLDIPDRFKYRDSKMVELIKERYKP